MLIDQTGRWIWYFNRHGAAPLVWCVAPECGEWEIAVSEVMCRVPVGTAYEPPVGTDLEDKRPSAYAWCEGRLTVSVRGTARIE